MDATRQDDRPTSPGISDSIMRWFRHGIGEPTTIQRRAWTELTADKHLLVSAPTGAGKTLAAFLPALDEMISEADRASASVWGVGSHLRIIYVAPLKALVNDVARNLTNWIEQIGHFLSITAPLPRVAIRHGDTSAEERRAFLDDPPEVLLTTPESLAVLLSQPDVVPLFRTVRLVIVDEIHALVSTKRGADLSLSLERMGRASAETLQRVGLSATATPADEVARFLVGPDRSCSVVTAPTPSDMELHIRLLAGSRSFLADLVTHIAPVIEAERSTLVFTNTRSLAERLSWVLRRHRSEWNDLIAVHHSSLAAARREEVERELKEGKLRAVVTSTSLELGIDIGPVDRVVLVHPPGDVVRLLQRLGRSGHGPGRIRRGLVLAASASEVLEAAVTSASGQAGQCEPLHVVQYPLDVLCQQILGMACTETWSSDEMYALVRQTYPFAELTRRNFDSCLAYLLGHDHRGQPWLPARLRGEPARFTIHNQRTARILRQNIGTILSDDAVSVCLISTEDELERPIGEVDPPFAERLQPGDRFLLDGRSLEVRRLESGRLLVEEVVGRPLTPRWTGEGWPLSTELARRLYALRVQAAESLRDGPASLFEMFRREYDLGTEEARALVHLFERQECVSEIPEPGVCLIEVLAVDQREVFFVHTPLNRAGNDALARVVVHRLARGHRLAAQSIVADLGWTLILSSGGLVDRRASGTLAPGKRPACPTMAELWRSLLDVGRFEEDLEEALADSITLRERFQRVATTGLMLLRNPAGRKRKVGGPRWGERRLFDQVRRHDPDFVLLRQAKREMRAACDAESARAFLIDLPRWLLRCRWVAQPSPLVEAWTQEVFGPFAVVETPTEALQRLHAQLTGS